jgi:transposase
MATLNLEGGGITSWVIHSVYEAFLPELLQPGDIFMHDGASVHTARIIRSLLSDMQIQVMVWPPYSPDLNPIENLWAVMKGIMSAISYHYRIRRVTDIDI